MAGSMTDDSDLPSFTPAKTWQGSKPGYYFGTSKRKGTGYHLDQNQLKKSQLLQQSKSPSSAVAKRKLVSSVDLPSAKRAKRSVVIAEDKNEVRTIPAASSAVLLEAEEAAKNCKVLDLSPRGVQLGIKNLKKAHDKNQMLRAEHPDDPEQYMDSELGLYEAITALQPIAADPPNLYPHLVPSAKPSNKNDNVEQLWMTTFCQLCMHENSDVVSSVVALLLELLDPSLLDMEQSNEHVNNRSIILLGRQIMENLLELLVANLARLQPPQSHETEDEGDMGIGKGVEDVLSLIENLLELDLLVQNNSEVMSTSHGDVSLVVSAGSVAAKIVRDTPFLSWLFEQIRDGTASKDRSLEILAFVVQKEAVHTLYPDWTKLAPYKSVFDARNGDEDNSNINGGTQDNRENNEEGAIDGMEVLLLHGIAPFRKKQPANETEVEALENAVIAVEAALTFSPKNVQVFLDAQGIELVLRCLKEKVHAGGVMLKLLDFSGSDPVYQKACEHFVAEAGGLKYLFPLYMGRQIPKPAIMSYGNSKSKNNNGILKAKKEWLHAIEDQTIRIVYALTQLLSEHSPNDAKQRLLVKFLEEDKSDRLVELCLAYDQRARLAEYKFWKSDVEDELKAEEAVQLAALEAKLRGGGDIFHRLGAIAGFCCVESKRCHERILLQLSLQKSGIVLIKAALEEFISVLGPGKQAEQLQSYHDAI